MKCEIIKMKKNLNHVGFILSLKESSKVKKKKNCMSQLRQGRR